MADFILAIDQGTTSSRALLFDHDGKIVNMAQQEFAQHFPQDGWVEHDPGDLWQSVLGCCREVLMRQQIGADQLTGIGITNQRETTLLWERKTGKPVHNAIVWQDRRTSNYCQSLKCLGAEAIVAEKTGLVIDPYFSATKLRWLLDEVPGARQQAENGELAFGTVDSWLLWCLTDGAEHRTDATNASRTLLFNIHSQQWDAELLEMFNIPASLLPEVMDCAAPFGMTAEDYLGVSVPILAMAGDQQSALFGQACFESGMAKSTYGTGCFVMLNTGDQLLRSQHRLLSTVGYRLNGKVTYALEGSIFVAGAAVQWLRDGLQLIAGAGETELLARQTDPEHGVYLVPAFTGLGAPWWDPDARGAIFGLTRDTGIREIVTAGLQSVCYQTRDLQEAMGLDGIRPRTLRVDGGMVVNNWLLQSLSDLLGVRVDRPEVIETTALGVASLVGLEAGVYKSLEQLSERWHCERQFSPRLNKTERDRFYNGWLDAVTRVQRTE
ncbi:MAG: glycerol kinase GlpK [Marinobacterium sp.]|nr:glycerol kinase GlpK [Marinobacterium sp.]